jgi:EAL domain-containing protein (putative c-di-GMP-specific phosphodiesterase class I)
MELVAEGVENAEQLEILRGYGCHFYQGYFSSQAVRLNAFEEILREDIKRSES